MIVPARRLLLFTALVLPFAALAGAGPELLVLAGAPAALLLVAALLDAAAAWNRLEGVNVSLPEVTRLSKDREGRLELRFVNEHRQITRLRLGLALPPEITSPHQDLNVILPAETPVSTVAWPIKPLKRGRYRLEKCYLETASPLGLWRVRGSAVLEAEVRVYPNIFPERGKLAALFLGRGTAGIHAQRQVGKGRDFEKLREYSPGDSYEDLHWKATAKRGFPVTKIFQLERTQEVYVILDASRLSARNAELVSERRLRPRPGQEEPRTTILERFVTAALIMGLAAERQGDLFGLVTFSDRVQAFVRAKNGKAHYNACREALYTLQPRPVTPDFTELFTFIGGRLRRRALLVVLTNMDDPVLAESFARDVHLISRRHLVLANMIRPPDARPLFSRPAVSAPDDLYRELGGHFLHEKLLETRKVLKQKNTAFALLDNEAMCTELVSQYLSVKQRQAL
ncbi:MAG: DUF58 domain-containing protein [Thermodesulfobacteriota bacterium]